MEQEQVVSTQFPPYFDRFINERDRRLIAELARLDANLAHNLRHIDQLRREIERSITDAKEYREMTREERRLGAASAKQEREVIRVEAEEKRETIRVEAKEERKAIRQEMRQGFVEAEEKREAILATTKQEHEGIEQLMEQGFPDAKQDYNRFHAKIDHNFRWLMGMMIFCLLEILVLLFLLY